MDSAPLPPPLEVAVSPVFNPPANPGDAPALTDDERTAGKYYVWNESNYQSDPATAWVLTTPE